MIVNIALLTPAIIALLGGLVFAVGFGGTKDDDATAPYFFFAAIGCAIAALMLAYIAGAV